MKSRHESLLRVPSLLLDGLLPHIQLIDKTKMETNEQTILELTFMSDGSSLADPSPPLAS